MDLKLQFKVQGFNDAMAEMYRKAGDVATQRQIIEYEVGRIVSSALAKTTAASVSSIRASVERREWITFENKKFRLDWHFPNPLWRRIAAARKASLQTKLAARGLAKKSWLALGLKLGQEADAPAFVAGAETPNHPAADNVSVDRKESPDGFGLRIDNHSPLLRWADGRQALFGAIAGRIEFYRRNVRMGVFDSIDKIAKKYPGLIVK